MNPYIKLKGTSDGYELHMRTEKLKEDVSKELKEAFQSDTKENDERYPLEIYGHDLYLNASEQYQWIKMIEEESSFDVSKVHTDLLSEREAMAFYQEESLVVQAGVLESGTLYKAPKDILFIGDVCPGAEIQAGGSIFVLGKMNGTAVAGRSRDAVDPVIIAEFGPLSQIRIQSAVMSFRQGSPTEEAMIAFPATDGRIDLQPLRFLKDIKPDVEELFMGRDVKIN